MLRSLLHFVVMETLKEKEKSDVQRKEDSAITAAQVSCKLRVHEVT